MGDKIRITQKDTFLIFYGALVGLLSGVVGNAWTTIWFEHVINKKGELHLHYAIISVVFILMLVVFVIGIVWALKLYPKGKTKKMEKSENSNPNGKNQTETKRISIIEALALVVAIISLVVSICLTNYSFQLTEQANRISEKNLELQNIQINSTAIIKTYPMQTVLDGGGYYDPDYAYSNSEVRSWGWLNGSLVILTPQVGILKINKVSFTPDDTYSNLLPEKTQLTEVNFYDDYAWRNREFFVNQGINPIEFKYKLNADFYPNPEKMPTLPYSSTVFPIGYLNLEAEFLTQGGYEYSATFDASIFVVVRTFLD